MNTDPGGGSGGGGDGRDSILSSFNLGSASRWVSGSSVDWRSLVAYIATVAALIVSETLGRLVSGLFALPRLAVDAVGDVYAALAGEVVGFWPEIFESAFSVQEVAFGELGVLGFLAAGAFVLVWFLVLNELVEVL